MHSNQRIAVASGLLVSMCVAALFLNLWQFVSTKHPRIVWPRYWLILPYQSSVQVILSQSLAGGRTTQQSTVPFSNPGLFHIVFSFSEKGESLCRALASAAALSYPVPLLVDRTDKDSNSTLQTDMDLRLKALEMLPADRDDDILLMMDSRNVWFQLGPQNLLSRYMTLQDKTRSASTILFAGMTDQVGSEDSHSNGSKALIMDAAMGTVGAFRVLLARTRDLAARNAEFEDTSALYTYLYRSQSQEQTPDQALPDLILRIDGDSGLFSDRAVGTWLEDSDTLPYDIRGAVPPFWNFALGNLHEVETWRTQLLLVNNRSRTIPATIMHGDSEADLAWHWSRTWYTNHLSAMYTTRHSMPIGPVAFAGSRFWWPDAKFTGTYNLLAKELAGKVNDVDACGGHFEQTLSAKRLLTR